jgi:peptidoglycan/LPS O-acetylase OafA/YrhL
MGLHVGSLTGLPWLAPHAYLAVDFFFALSGFVVAFAYNKDLAHGMSGAQFFAKRMLRLWPLVILGAVLGSTYLLVREHLNPTPAASLAVIVCAMLYALAAVPMLFPPSPWGLTPVNGPSWTLFYEVLANMAYACWVRKLGRTGLIAVTLVGAAALLGLAPILHGVGAGNSVVFAVPSGVARVTFSMFLGVLIERAYSTGRLPRIAAPTYVLAAILGIAMFVPTSFGAVFDLTFVFLISPALLVAGLNAISSRWLRKAELALGWLSYPLYIVQVPAISFAISALKVTHIVARVPNYGVAILCAIIAIAAGVAAGALDDRVQAVIKERRMRASYAT